MKWLEKKLRDMRLSKEAEGVYKRERNLAKGQVEREEAYLDILKGKKTRAAKMKNVKNVLNAIGSWSRNVQSGFVESERPRRRRKKKR